MGVLEEDGSEKIGTRTGEAILCEDDAEVTEGPMADVPDLRRMLVRAFPVVLLCWWAQAHSLPLVDGILHGRG